MTSLIRIEWLKMRKYNAFWWIMILTILAYPGINYIFYSIYVDVINQPTQAGQYAKLGLGNPFAFPESWHTIAYSSSLFVFIPAVIVIMFITNEYTFKTHRQNVIDGWSRNQFVTSKLIDVLLVTIIVTLMCGIAAFTAGMLNRRGLFQHTWDQVYYLGLFALLTFAQLSIAFLIGFLVRKAFLALGIFIFYYMLIENIAVGLMTYYKIPGSDYLPLQISDMLVPPPGFIRLINPEGYQARLDAISLHIPLTIILTTLVWLICYRINARRDLK
jgi:ABC-type phosphate/phosphonate transport system permease subunit